MPTQHPDVSPNPEQADSCSLLLAPGSSSPEGTSAPKGTRRTRLNAFRHGLTGQIMVLLPEEQTAYDAHCTAIKSAYNPKGALEETLVQSIVDAQWRLKRAVSFENSFFAMNSESAASATGNPEVDVAFAQARAFLARPKDFALLSVYENRIHRRMEKDIARLEVLQEKRRDIHAEAMAKAKKLYQLAKAQSKPYEPEAYFKVHSIEFNSVFSPEAVAHEISRDATWKAAEDYAFRGRLPQPIPISTPDEEAA